MDEKISECYKCSGLHEIEQIAMRSVCLEMSSNMFSLGLKSIILGQKLLSQIKIRSLRGLYLSGRAFTRRQRGARGCLQKQKKILLILIITSLFGLQTSVRTVAS